MINQELLNYFLYFCIMANIGWIIESVYRSCMEKRFVNGGFLSGPFIPVYGFGAVLITLVNEKFSGLPAVLAWTITLIAPTILEYFVSWLMERLFGLKLWDYQHERFNVYGRICLKFSAYWAVLAVILVLIIKPLVFSRIGILGPYYSHFIAGGLLAYFVVDSNHSVRSVYNFKAFQKNITALIEKGKLFSPAFDPGNQGRKPKLPIEIRRVLKPLVSFPALRKDFRKKLIAFPDWIKERLEEKMGK